MPTIWQRTRSKIELVDSQIVESWAEAVAVAQLEIQLTQLVDLNHVSG